GNVNFVIDVYRRNTNNLLFDPALPATAGIASPPIVNVGKMRNTGFDVSVGHTASWWNVAFNGSHYHNEIISINGTQTFFDRTIIGSPHPKFTAGMDLGVHRGNWDASATFFGSYGNKLFENQMEFYVFREFETNVKKDLLANSWSPTNLNPKYPRIDINDTFSRALSSYYVKSGTYTRLRNLQLGYTIPSAAQYLQ